jgi:hypothetical protein
LRQLPLAVSLGYAAAVAPVWASWYMAAALVPLAIVLLIAGAGSRES